MTWIDTHAHLNLSAFNDDVEAVVGRCMYEDVSVINIGTKLSTSQRAVDLAAQHDHLYAIVGLHPIQTVAGTHDEDEIGEGGQPFISRGEAFDMAAFRTLGESPKVVGIGECGFDYWHCPKDTYELQETAFLKQIELANELKERGHHVILVDYQPTSENMVVDFSNKIKARLPETINLFSLKLQETESSFAEWFASDNQ